MASRVVGTLQGPFAIVDQGEMRRGRQRSGNGRRSVGKQTQKRFPHEVRTVLDRHVERAKDAATKDERHETSGKWS